MKTLNLILAIIIFLCIPSSFFSGFVYDVSNAGTFPFFTMIMPIILFIIGVVILIMGREDRKKDEQQKSNIKVRELERRCLFCNRIIPRDAILCPYCGQKLDSDKEKKL